MGCLSRWARNYEKESLDVDKRKSFTEENEIDQISEKVEVAVEVLP